MTPEDKILEEIKKSPVARLLNRAGLSYFSLINPNIRKVAEKAVEEISVLHTRIDKLEDELEGLESLRPHWAQGFTEDSVAAQSSQAALSQLWELIGAKDQTQAVQILKASKENNHPDYWTRWDINSAPIDEPVQVIIQYQDSFVQPGIQIGRRTGERFSNGDSIWHIKYGDSWVTGRPSGWFPIFLKEETRP